MNCQGEIRMVQRGDPPVGIVVLNYKNPQMTIRCLDSLLKLEYLNWEAVVVDNDSRDGSVEMITAAHPWIKMIQSKANLGYAGGNKLGYDYFSMKSKEYLWVLNNDAIADEKCLSAMVGEIGKSETIGAVGSLICDAENPGIVLAHGGGKVSWLTGRVSHITSLAELNRLDFLTGASLLIPVEIIKEVGFIDEGYFLYYEDVDFCLNLRKKGFSLAVAEGAIIFHSESATLGRRSVKMVYYMNRSFIRFVMTHAPAPIWTLLVGLSARMVKRLITGRWKEARVLWRASMDGWKGRGQPFGEAKFC